MTTVETERPQTAEAVEALQDARWWAPHVASAVISLMVTACALLIYHGAFTKPPLRLGLVDVAAIVDGKEMIFTAAMTMATSEAERTRLLAAVGEIEPGLKQALAEVRAECQCEILVKAAAFASPNLTDYTNVVASKLGVRNEDLAAARATVRDALLKRGAQPPADAIAKPTDAGR